VLPRLGGHDTAPAPLIIGHAANNVALTVLSFKATGWVRDFLDGAPDPEREGERPIGESGAVSITSPAKVEAPRRVIAVGLESPKE
jgi:hypothetical protein